MNLKNTSPNNRARFAASHPVCALLGLLLLLSACATPPDEAAEAAAAQAPKEWPRVLVGDGITNTIYQPQLDSWDYVTLRATSAIAVQPEGASQATFGTITFVARTVVDRASREVWFQYLNIEKADFPSAGAQANKYLATLRSLLPVKMDSISLDRLEASLAILEAREKASGQPLKNDPPAIVFSSSPALLVLVEGPAVYRAVQNTHLERVFNTRALILRDSTGKHYLHLYDGYLEAPALTGPWTVAQNPPNDLKKAEEQAVKAKQVDLLAGQENPETKQMPSLKSNPVPMIQVAMVPTELIVIQSQPQWLTIPSTQLAYVNNTSAHVFKELTGQKIYVLLSGRWFRSASLEGPWEFVPGADLPRDFANIPDDSPEENVKASVPGTRQAKEAAIANSIPHTVKVDRHRAAMDPLPQYEGAPQLKPIEGTRLSYVANCALPVIQVDARSWYACENGVWFAATAPSGPWVAATNVPAAIYSIPPSSPMHYVVYSRIYNYYDDYIWVGITPGYYGAMVGPDGVVVYGTGYVYPPYLGETLYVSYGVTYGYGSDPCWTPWAGWAYGFTAGFAMACTWDYWCCCPCCPYWGPYWATCYGGAYYNAYGGITAWGPYGWAGTSGYVYHQNGPWTGVSQGAAGYNAWTGNQWASRYGRAYNSTTGTSVIGWKGCVRNVYTGNTATYGRATVYNPESGKTTHISAGQGSGGGSFVNVNGHVVVGKDGNYYRPDGSGGWTQITRPPTASPAPGATGAEAHPNLATTYQQQQWQPAQVTPQQRQALDQQVSARDLGAQRQQSFQMNRPAFRGGGFGGRR
jgi:hypothetical protein